MRSIILVLFFVSNFNLSAQTFYLKSTSYTWELFLLNASGEVSSVRNNEGYESPKASRVGTWEAYENTISMEIAGKSSVYEKKNIENIYVLVHKKYSNLEFESFEQQVKECIAKDKFYQELFDYDSLMHKQILERIKEDLVSWTLRNHDILVEKKKEYMDDDTIRKFVREN